MKLAELLNVDTTKENWFKLLSKKGINPKTVNVVKSGASITEAPFKDVNFYDYDGTILYSYDADEFLKLNALPELKDKEGLISNGWNYTLEEAKELVSQCKMADIGALYETSDGATNLYIEINDYINNVISMVIPNPCTIDWGDDSELEEWSGSAMNHARHSYNKLGEYVIKLYPKKNNYIILGGGTSGNCINPNYLLKRLEFGKDIYLHQYTFDSCINLETISIPRNVKGWDTTKALTNCYSLKHITFPPNLTNYPSVSSGYSLKSISIPKGISTLIGTGSCYTLRSLCIPVGVTKIKANTYVNNYLLERICFPSTITSTAMNNSPCKNLKKVIITEGATGLYNSEFYQSGLVTVKYPKSVTKIPSHNQNNNLKYIDLLDFDDDIPEPGDSKYSIGTNAYIIVNAHKYMAYAAHSGWKLNITRIITDIVPETVRDLEIQADDLPASGGKPLLYVSARCDGNKMTTGEKVVNGEYKFAVYYNTSFAANGSTESRTLELSYTYKGVTATTTITQAGAEVTE